MHMCSSVEFFGVLCIKILLIVFAKERENMYLYIGACKKILHIVITLNV